MTLFYKHIRSPVGRLKLVASENALLAVLWEKERPGRVRLEQAEEDAANSILTETERQLSEYFARQRTAFDLSLEEIL